MPWGSIHLAAGAGCQCNQVLLLSFYVPCVSASLCLGVLAICNVTGSATSVVVRHLRWYVEHVVLYSVVSSQLKMHAVLQSMHCCYASETEVIGYASIGYASITDDSTTPFVTKPTGCQQNAAISK